ncbi:MAG: bifunctional alpha,alpha-trehalose-phosphate synthase (UDP-forming)/trehalose-phosphatase [Candidatus Nanopelagicales bacterium]
MVIVANRLPVEHNQEEGWRRAPGGLVSAMDSVLRDREATWVGWSGQFEDEDGAGAPALPDRIGDVQLVEIGLTAEQVAAHYDGFSNGALWPNYHGGIVPPAYHRHQFVTHRDVNELFAGAVAEAAGPDALVWVHDYQLQLVPAMLRRLRPDLRIGFFLHIPFPPLEVFSQIPWRRQIVEGLLGADVIGFQTHDAVGNFVRAAHRFGEVEDCPGGLTLAADPARLITVRAFPIGIRATDYADLAKRPEIRQRARQVRRDVGDPAVLLLGVDRLDYTKGIDARIQAVTELLLDGELDPRRTAFIQVAPPTRAKVEEYQKIRDEVELLVSRANGTLGPLGTNPIHYLHQPMPAEELVALYSAADVMLVTPLRDGMNLVAKEYVATRTANTGALVLSEFTGAAEQMGRAWLVNPYDIGGMKRTIMEALAEPAPAARTRMADLRAGVFAQDVTWWANDFLTALRGDGPADSEGLPDELIQAIDGLKPERPLLVALDFDGTLSHLVPEPSIARPAPGVLEALERLGRAPRTSVVIISGRALHDLAEVSGAAELALLIGSHGQEHGRPMALSDDESTRLASLRAAAKDAIATASGAWIEDKPAGFGVHVRACSPADAERVVERVRSLADPARGAHAIEGKLVIEISVRPLDKGSALQAMIDQHRDCLVVFAGDDVTDETAMAALRPEDISIKVGDGDSIARHRIADPTQMVDVLSALARVRGS